MTINGQDLQEYLFSNDLVKKSRTEHKCDACKKIIKKGISYYRRSFGRLWTWKACSIPCAERMVEASKYWC